MCRSVLFACAVLPLLAMPLRAQTPGEVQLDPSRVLSRADTFEIRIAGNGVGMQITTMERTPEGFVFRETSTTPAGTQTTEVQLGSDLSMRSVKQEGRIGGAEMHIDLRYTDGLARGNAQVPGPEGIQTLDIDTRVPANAVDDNVLIALVPAMPWAAGAEWTVPVFASGRGALVTHTFRVDALQPADSATGTPATWRVDVTGGDVPLVMHVAADAPHHLVRIEIAGSPVEMVRMSGGGGGGR